MAKNTAPSAHEHADAAGAGQGGLGLWPLPAVRGREPADPGGGPVGLRSLPDAQLSLPAAGPISKLQWLKA